MKKFLDKAKSALDKRSGDANQVPLQERPSTIQSVSAADVTRYHYHHGTNLGTVFVLEKWLTGSMFPENARGSSELAAVTAWVEKEGIEAARQRFERHWKEYVSDADLDWLRDHAKCNCVRLPIGYYVLGPPYCDNTPFKNVAAVYQNAWAAVRDIVARCHQRGIGVVLDMHALPGGANAQDHSGTDSGKAEFWGSRSNQDLATRALCFIAQQTRGMEGIAAIQIINEAEHATKGMFDWYGNVLSQLSSIDASMPVYISDAWDLPPALTWQQKTNSVRTATNPVIVDTHLYWCFGDDGKPPQHVIQEVEGKLAVLQGKEGNVLEHGAAQVIVGEYSCVLGERSWANSGGEPKDDLVRRFGNTESQCFQQRTGGSFFWTYRMDWMPGGEWGFKNTTEKQAIVPPRALALPSSEVKDRLNNAQNQRSQRKDATVSSHCNYWDSKHPGQYEHWRFEQGWDLGYTDASSFFGMRNSQGLEGADKIGLLDAWCLKRLRESGQAGPFVWEFEQGLRQGIRDFYQSVDV